MKKADSVGNSIEALMKPLRAVSDPRVDRTKRHPLMNILVMALTATIAGASGWDDIAFFAEHHREWFDTFLDAQASPCADTFRRVFGALRPSELQAALVGWTNILARNLSGQVVALDGKALRGTKGKTKASAPLHLLHAWAVDHHLLLGQERVHGAPGEVKAIPELLKRLNIKGAIVTTDANGCTAAVTQAVRERDADYILGLKGNRAKQHTYAQKLFASNKDKTEQSTHRSESKAHGRKEVRVVRVLEVDAAKWPGKKWRDLRCIAMVERTRIVGTKTSQETAYYISSLKPDAQKIASAIRSHWGIENNLHWMLDVVFDEDSRRISDANAAENLALLNRLALMMLKKSPEKLSMPMKRKKANWDPAYLLQLLARETTGI